MRVLDNTVPIRRIANMRNGGTPTADAANWGGAIPWATPRDVGRVHGGYLDSTERTITEVGSSNGAPVVPPGSVILSTRAPVGYIAITTEEMAFNQGCRALIPRTSMVSSRYLSYALQSSTEKLNAAAQGTTFLELSSTSLSDIRVPLPPRDRQQLIVDFLDRETAEIDAFIADQEQLIELWEERRAATITHAVTKGLDPTVSMKDSGIEWLVETPVSWKIAKLRYLASVGTGASDTVDATEDGDYPFFVRSQTPERIGYYSYDTEAVLTAGDGAGVGRVFHHFNGKFEAHQRVYVIQDFINVKGRYIYYFMSALFGPVILAGTAKSTVESLRRPMLTDFHIALPPQDEQEAIISFLDSETAKIDAAIGDAREAIALSRERRAALISAAVTGQIDVSQAQRPVDEVLEQGVQV